MESFRSLWRIALFCLDSIFIKLLLLGYIGWIVYCTITFNTNPLLWLGMVLAPPAFIIGMILLVILIGLGFCLGRGTSQSQRPLVAPQKEKRQMYSHLFFYVLAVFCLLMMAGLSVLIAVVGSGPNSLFLVMLFSYAGFGLLYLFLGEHQQRRERRSRN